MPTESPSIYNASSPFVHRLPLVDSASHPHPSQCESSGRSGLDFFTALHSEREEKTIVHQRFPEQLKPRILRAVQFRTCPSHLPR